MLGRSAWIAADDQGQLRAMSNHLPVMNVWMNNPMKAPQLRPPIAIKTSPTFSAYRPLLSYKTLPASPNKIVGLDDV
jgi:hypothetical protein